MSNFTCTTKELAERVGVDDITAQGLLKYLRVKGIAQEIGERYPLHAGTSEAPVR